MHPVLYSTTALLLLLCAQDSLGQTSVGIVGDGLARLNASVQHSLHHIEEIIFQQMINTTLSEQKQTEIITGTIQSLLRPIAEKLQCIQQMELGKARCNPAESCSQIKETNPTSSSGHYWIKPPSGNPVIVYCDMTRTCGGITGGWMQVSNINMQTPSSVCPGGLVNVTNENKSSCAMPSSGPGCASTSFEVHGISYSKVCGRVQGYQHANTDAFNLYYNRGYTIDHPYVDGVSLTHGQPRHHIWTFASALDEREDTERHHMGCSCTSSRSSGTFVPHFIGSDYFCDTAPETRSADDTTSFYGGDPLWDGAGCGDGNTCCEYNRPPWFSKQLGSSTTEDIELRICRDQGREDEDVTVELIEIYVQ